MATILIKDQRRTYTVDTNQIIALVASGCYTRIVIQGHKEILISKPIKSFLNILPMNEFFRCHNSFVINISKFCYYDNKSRMIALTGLVVPLSRGRKARFFDYLIKASSK